MDTAVSREPRRDPPDSRDPAGAAATYRSARWREMCELRRAHHSSIARDLQRYVPVRFTVRGRDLKSADRRRQATGRRNRCKLPEAFICNGRANTVNCRRPTADSKIVVPFALLLIGRAVFGDAIADRHVHHHGADPGRLPRRHPGAVPDRHTVQCLGRGRLHLDFRHRGNGRHSAELLYPQALAGGPPVSGSESSWVPTAASARS